MTKSNTINKRNDIKQKDPDDTSHIFVYGSIIIKDVKSNKILIKKSF